MAANNVTNGQSLPSGEELEKERATVKANGRQTTLEEIGERYGVSRQAVHKALAKWRERRAKANASNDASAAGTS